MILLELIDVQSLERDNNKKPGQITQNRMRLGGVQNEWLLARPCCRQVGLHKAGSCNRYLWPL